MSKVVKLSSVMEREEKLKEIDKKGIWNKVKSQGINKTWNRV